MHFIAFDTFETWAVSTLVLCVVLCYELRVHVVRCALKQLGNRNAPPKLLKIAGLDPPRRSPAGASVSGRGGAGAVSHSKNLSAAMVKAAVHHVPWVTRTRSEIQGLGGLSLFQDQRAAS